MLNPHFAEFMQLMNEASKRRPAAVMSSALRSQSQEASLEAAEEELKQFIRETVRDQYLTPL